MANPVRIYVLHHPESKLARALTDRIYNWFRLPSLEGIPVYVRSMPEDGKNRPALPQRKKGEPCLEYIVPLADAFMVRDPVWHAYLSDIAQGAVETEQEPEFKQGWGWAVFPVAMDSTAFNLPDGVARTNFIRYGGATPPSVACPGHPSAEERAAQAAYETRESEETLKHLTEAIARDLNMRLFRAQAERFKIFISYARADGTAVPKALRNYIQGQTQCLVFFDENDIGFGQAFGKSIGENVGELARAMIVVNGDNYAERPWCRWEIDRFTRPKSVELPSRGDGTIASSIQFFQPLLVVDTMSGPKMTRMVPELAQAPVVRWEEGRERICFSALMREVVLGLRDVMAARMIQPEELTGVIVNRLPGPVALARLVSDKEATEVIVRHPGHGLPLAELRLLERSFPKIRFEAFRDIHRDLPPSMARNLKEKSTPLRGKVITLSTAHHHRDLAALGYLTQHQDEALIHLLRPLLRLGADLMYGGTAPVSVTTSPASEDQSVHRNITLTLLQLLGDERQVVESDLSGANTNSGSMLFNIAAWPRGEAVTEADEASWINACRVKRIKPTDAGLGVWTGRTPNETPGKFETVPEGYRRMKALTFSHQREIMARGFRCPVPKDLDREVAPSAFVFIGGATDAFKGVMPGVMEEFLRAAQQAEPAIPIYLMGGLGGATRLMARALMSPPSAPCPPGLTQEFYQGKSSPYAAEYNALLKELKPKEKTAVSKQFKELWAIIKSRRGSGKLDNLFSNGLSDADNRLLLTTPNTISAVGLIWKGLSNVFLTPQIPNRRRPQAPKKKPRTVAKSR